MKKYTCLGVGMAAFFFVASHAYAATSVAGPITNNVTWNKEGSPYVLEDVVSISSGVKLSIEPGVEIQLNGNGIEAEGFVDARGSGVDRISISDTGSGWISLVSNNAPSYFSYVDFKNVGSIDGVGTVVHDHNTFSDTGVSQNKGSLSISHSSFSRGFFGVYTTDATTTITDTVMTGYTKAAVYVRRGFLLMTGNTIERNVLGVWVQDSNPVLSFLRSLFISEVRADSLNGVKITQNSLIENQKNIQNDAVLTVDARENWWSSDISPVATISGNVLFDPWLHAPPNEDVCCSNVLFLPGLQSSRLYRDGALGENQLWEPNRDGDVADLSMNDRGESVRKDIYTRDVIPKTNIAPFRNVSIYQAFIEAMNGVVAAGAVNAWKPFAYDWRYGPESVVASTTLIADIEQLASSSKTHKVTIVAHSYGGIVARQLIEKLSVLHKDGLIDRVIFVAVPHLGTPKAIVSLMYGDGQEIMGGIALSQLTAKQFAFNLPSAYMLLPSTSYFARAFLPVITTATSSVTTKPQLNSFMLGMNQHVLSESNMAQQRIGTAAIPGHISVDSIVGTGLETIDSLALSTREEIVCGVGRSCETEHSVDRIPHFTSDGDGTVVGLSARGTMNQVVHEFDLHSINAEAETNHKHADILEIPTVISCVINLLTNKECVSESVSSSVTSKLLISVHSPIDVHLFDSTGRHTGIIAGSSTEFRLVEESIPNSSYLAFGEGKYITSQNDSSDGPSTIVLDGTGIGTFTLAISSTTTPPYGDQNPPLDADTHSVIFSDIPVTSLTTGKVSLGGSAEPILELDVDGDGIYDATTTAASSSDPLLLTKTLRAFIATSDMPAKTKEKLLTRLDKIEKNIVKKKIRTIPNLNKLIGRIDTGRAPFKKLDPAVRQTVLDMFERLLDALD